MWFFPILIVYFRTKICGRWLDLLKNGMDYTTLWLSKSSLSLISKHHLFNKEKIWLHHLMLEQPSFKTFKSFLRYLSVYPLWTFTIQIGENWTEEQSNVFFWDIWQLKRDISVTIHHLIFFLSHLYFQRKCNQMYFCGRCVNSKGI